MASVDTPDPSLDIEDNSTSASFMPKESGDGLEEAKETDVSDHIEDPDGLEEAKETDVSDHIEDPTCQKSKRPHTLTEKGLEYQRLLKEKDYQRALRKLKDKLHKLDMDWIDISDPHILRKERSDIEEFRQDLDKAQSEYVPLLTGKESHDVVEATACLNKQVVELRMRIGEKIFQLEKEELCSRGSKRSFYSKKTGSTRVSKGSSSSQVSLLKMKALTELAKKEVEMKYARIEAEKKLEMERKKHEIEEIQRIKSYESAKAEVDAAARLEEEDKNPNLDDLKEFQLKEDKKEDRVRDYISSLPDLTSVSSQIPLPDSFVRGSTAQHLTSSSQKAKDTELSKTDRTPQGPGNGQSKSASKQELVTPPPLHITSSTTPYGTLYEAPTIPYCPPVMETQQHGIAQAIAEGMEAARLPTPHLSVFSGNPLDWPTWKVSFETVIEKNSMNSNEKILYLLQYLSGPPKKIVEGYQFLKTDDAYTDAKKTLEKRFGHPSVVAEAFRRKLENWPKIPPKDGCSLREFADFLKTC